MTSSRLSDDAVETAFPLRPKAETLELPLISVIVTCYNHAPFLEKCLDSIVGQTYPKLQLIVVDNASTDNSREVIERYAADTRRNGRDLVIEPVYSATNDREMGAMLQGFAKARGRYIGFVDGDDWLLPQCMETHIKAHLVSRLAIGVTSVDMYQSSGDEIVVGTGKRVSEYVMSKRGHESDFVRMENLAAFDFPPEAPGWEFRASDLHLITPALGHEWYWSPTSGLVFRREAIELMFNPKPLLRDGADGFLVRGVNCLTGGITIDRPLAVYRTHGSNLFTKHPQMENMLSYVRDQCHDLDLDISEAVLRCFDTQMEKLAKGLEIVDVYINAIKSLDTVALKRKAGKYSSFTARYLIENRARIVSCFGEATYKAWAKRFLSLKERVVLAIDMRKTRAAAAGSMSGELERQS